MSQHLLVLIIHLKHCANTQVPIHVLLEYEEWWNPSYRLGNGRGEDAAGMLARLFC